MVRQYIILCLLFMVTVGSAFGGTLMFENANQLYRSKQYAEASELYMQIINDGYGSGAVYYNAGNAFYKCNKLGYAIWCYYKALQFKPNDAIITDNLLMAKSKLKQGDDGANGFSVFKKAKALLNIVPLNTWAYYSWLIFMLVIIIRLLQLWTKAPLFLIGMRKLFTALFLLVFVITIANYLLNKFNKLAIVVEATGAYKTEKEKGKGSGEIAEGTQVILKNANENGDCDKFKIKLPNGKICWVLKTAVKKI